MKKQLPGFILGFLCAVMLFGLVVSGSARITGNTTIEVEPINIMVNGKVFEPKDANGNPVDVFTYNGSTYAPLRALAEAYGLKVDYDAEKNMATVTDPDTAADPDEGSFIINNELQILTKDGTAVTNCEINGTLVMINKEVVSNDYPIIIKYDTVNYVDIQFIIDKLGIKDISRQEILDWLSEKNGTPSGEYLVCGDKIYIKPLELASEFGIRVSVDWTSGTICFEAID